MNVRAGQIVREGVLRVAKKIADGANHETQKEKNDQQTNGDDPRGNVRMLSGEPHQEDDKRVLTGAERKIREWLW